MTPTTPRLESIGAGTRRRRWPAALWIDLAGFAALASVSLLTGLAVNALRHPPLPWVYHTEQERLREAVSHLSADGPPPDAPAGVAATRVREIELEEFAAFVHGRGLVIDARPPLFYGQGHVPGAINLPREGFESAYARLGARLAAHRADTVAVYCSEADCPDAQMVAGALGALGFRRLLVYREGWEEWSQSGMPQEK